jgi:V8-like Glu-specific endopeptidase
LKLILLLVGLALSLNVFALDPKAFQTTVGLILEKSDFKTICSGELLAPKVVLTSAHCLTDLKSVRVINDEKISSLQYRGFTGNKYFGTQWYQHPAYDGTNPGSIDIGIIILNRPIKVETTYHNLAMNPLEFLNTDDSLIRVGYGLRDGNNRRNIFNMTFAYNTHSYAAANDLNGMGGDSGGPVFTITHDGLALIGVHCGRLLDMEGNPLPLSYMQVLDRSTWQWVDSVARDYFIY